MAANDYYDTPSEPSRKRVDGPLPPVPYPYSSYTSNPQQHQASSISSPFEDPSYRPYGRQSSQSLASDPAYNNAGSGRHEFEPSPYSDNIPLRPQLRKSSSDLLNSHYRPSDAEGARPPLETRKKSRTGATRRKKKKGLWSGRIPFVVYFFTLVQVIVFIAELVKSGM
jgi:hypothetical protein